MPKTSRSQATKQHILASALKLFNRDGFVNVRLQHIADEAIVSVGNLAYHFPNKEAIFNGIYQQILQEQKELLTEFRIVPLFDYLEKLIQLTYLLQQKYIFFYMDTLEILRAFPEQSKTHQNQIQWQENLLNTMIEFNVSRGAFIPEPFEGIYNQTAIHFRISMDNWLMQTVIRGLEAVDVNNFSHDLWCLLIPFFTETGKLEYRQMRQLLDNSNL